MSQFLIQITRVDKAPVLLRPGGRGERDLVSEVTKRVKEAGVGFFRTEAQVVAAVEAALTQVLHELKSEVVPRG